MKFLSSDVSRNTSRGGFEFGAPPLLTLFKKEGQMTLAPKLGSSPSRECRFNEWWTGIVYTDVRGHEISRRKLTRFLRNQDGGSHVDESLRDESYSHFSRRPSAVRWNNDKTVMARVQVDETNSHWLTMRQIAWELDESLKLIGY